MQNDTDSDSDCTKLKQNTEQQIRIKNKSNRIKEKFKGLLKSRKHERKPKQVISQETDMNSDLPIFKEDMSSVEKIKEVKNII